MGARVRVRGTKKPDTYVFTPCPHCGKPQRVFNGALLRWWRESAGINQRAFGRLVNASGPYISDIETNRRDCPPDILETYKDIAQQ